MRKGSISYYDLVLVGGGHAHLAVLESLAKKAIAGLRCCLITPSPLSIYSGMLPGWMAGFFSDDEIQIDVSALAKAAGITLLLDEAVGLETDRKCLKLRSGRHDWLWQIVAGDWRRDGFIPSGQPGRPAAGRKAGR